jgi:hypothetical protein
LVKADFVVLAASPRNNVLIANTASTPMNTDNNTVASKIFNIETIVRATKNRGKIYNNGFPI